MINKPTAESVMRLTGTELDECTVGDIIDDAALIAKDCLATLDADTQAAALKWFAAHMIAGTSDEGSQVLASSKLGDGADSYARGTLGTGLDGTYYGQQAVAIAPCLSRVGKTRASIEVI